MNLRQVLSVGKKVVVKNLPTILTAVGVVGVGVTGFLAGRGALTAERYLNSTVENPDELDLKTKARITYKCYIPAVTTGLITTAAIVGANRISLKQLATMATTAAAAERALSENREKVKELFGKNSLRKVDEKLNESHAARYFSNLDDVYETGTGSVLCCEGLLTGKKFRASPEWIHKCVNDFNAELNAGNPQSYNDFLQLLMPNIDVRSLPAMGDILGYNLEINGRLMEISLDSGLLEGTHEPYLIFTQRNFPLTNYLEYM